MKYLLTFGKFPIVFNKTYSSNTKENNGSEGVHGNSIQNFYFPSAPNWIMYYVTDLNYQ